MHKLHLLPTMVVGSYPQPDWLIDREKLSHVVASRADAETVAHPGGWSRRRTMRRSSRSMTSSAPGIDIISDGEIRRESYSNRFSNALAGVDAHKEG